MTRLFDAHTHIDMKHYKNDRDNVILRAKEAGLEGIVTSSMSPASFRHTLGIVKKYRGFVHHSAGCQVSRLTSEIADSIITLIRRYSDDIVAVGEVGLDYYWIKDPAQRKAQEPLFHEFISLANEMNLPLVIHSRKAEAEATSILEREFSGNVLMHCFDGNLSISNQIRDNGWFITLPANFAKYRNRREAAKTIPLEQILLETDGPYLSPTGERNEPANISIGCQELAKFLDLCNEEVGDVTTENAIKFYRL